MRRNDRLILFRDTNFGKDNKFASFLSSRRAFAKSFSGCNAYFENETESALKFIEKKKYNQIIIITNNGADSGGIEFVKRAREIIGSDVVVLFMCKQVNNIKWIQELPNVLFTNREEFFERFITNFTEEGLRKLRKDINEHYHIKERFGSELSDFTDGFYSFPHYEEFKSGGNIANLHFEPVKEVPKWGIEQRILYVCDSVCMMDYGADEGKEAPWYSEMEKIVEIKIIGQPVKIGDYAFRGCKNIKAIHIPETVTEIGNGAFCYCSSLTSISLSKSTKAIGNYAFCGCSLLTSISIPDNVTTIGDGAFSGCSSLASIVISDSVTSIGSQAFRGCSSLKSISIPNVTKIPSCVLCECSSLASIIIPDNVTAIEDFAFNKCSSLKAIYISNNVKSIDECAFQSCTSLTSIAIPKNVETIKDKAFNNCSNLFSASVPKKFQERKDKIFIRCPKLKTINWIE